MLNGPAGVKGDKGDKGDAGNPGRSVLNGLTNPSNLTDGINGDFYVNTATYTLFGPKTGGIWGPGTNIVGPIGEKGDTGDTGPKGDTGDTGATGATGDKGDIGNTGPMGSTGPKGDTGDVGTTGPKGDTGDAGPTGAKGDTGNTGPGVATGGTVGQVLSKVNSTDFNTQWVDPPIGIVKSSGAELNTGTDDAKFVTAAGLEDSKYLTQSGAKVSATASGTNTYTATIFPAITAYNSTQRFYILFTNANTGAATLNLNSLGAKAIKKNVSVTLSTGDILAGQILCLAYDGTNFQIINSFPAAIPTVSSGEKLLSITSTGVQKNYDAVDQIISSSALTSADWTSGAISYTGFTGQYAFDANYRYDCVGVNSWKRSVFSSNSIDLYLSPIDDSAGAKTSTELNAAYPSASIGQKVYGIQFYYEKYSSTIWKKTASIDA
ncbi:collagen-like protein [Mucilaginibacter mali]|uniref:Collagen-like protein n=2 Tax=Mucilaginibacter mali TaxID=2740462 RepID=A0A7D4U0K2_9SPHI|nr:collagen-like protein [Mucilaginibacter mali]